MEYVNIFTVRSINYVLVIQLHQRYFSIMKTKGRKATKKRLYGISLLFSKLLQNHVIET